MKTETRRKIVILNFDISNNSLGRAYILWQALSQTHDVEIIGTSKRGIIWEPLKDSNIPIKIIPFYKFPLLFFKLPKILKEINNGDIIYALKPRFTSFGFGLLKKIFDKTPLILDIDDWEVGFYMRKNFWSRLLKFLNISNPNGLFWTWILQFFIKFADKKTTVSKFLQNLYGGEIIPHAKDTDYLDPERFRNNDLREQLKLVDKKIVLFLGTPRAHKGVEDAVQAVLMIDDPNLIMVIIGADPTGDYEKRLIQLGGLKLRLIEYIPIQDLPKYLMLADIVVIPQKHTPDTVGQIPSKLFDAMAMAKPIISTKVSDIPEILQGCGIIVNPESPIEIRDAILWILKNPEKAHLMGLKAREKCIKYYSLQSIKEKLKRIIGELLEDKKTVNSC